MGGHNVLVFSWSTGKKITQLLELVYMIVVSIKQ